MQTRFAADRDWAWITARMRDSNCGALRTKAALRKFVKNGGLIVMTHTDAGQVYALLFVDLIDHPLTVAYLQGRALMIGDLPADDMQAGARSLSRYLRCLLRHHGAAWLQMDLHEMPPEFAEQLLPIGFLLAEPCDGDGCNGGMYMLCDTQEHMGGVVIERILAGNTQVLGEV